MKKYYCHLCLIMLFSTLNISCAVMFKNPKKKAPPVNTEKLSKVINAAIYDVCNMDIFTNTAEYEGKIISFSGYVGFQEMLKPKDKVFTLTGSINGKLIDIVVYLDSEIPKQSSLEDDKELISRGKVVRIFGVFQEFGDYMYDNGISKKSPNFRAIVIYNSDDTRFKKPLWIANGYK